MNSRTIKHQSHPVVQEFRNFFRRLFQSPDTYTIRYYKKNKKFRRHWQESQIK